VRQRHADLYGLLSESINAEMVSGGSAGRNGGRLGRLRCRDSGIKLEARLDKHIVLRPCLTTSLVVRGNRTTLPCTQKSLQASFANVLQLHRHTFAAAANLL